MEETKEAALLSFLTPFKNKLLGFPGDPVVKNVPCNARRQFNPWSGRIAHAAGQLSQYTTATEPGLWSHGPQLLSPQAANMEAPQQEKPLQ